MTMTKAEKVQNAYITAMQKSEWFRRFDSQVRDAIVKGGYTTTALFTVNGEPYFYGFDGNQVILRAGSKKEADAWRTIYTEAICEI